MLCRNCSFLNTYPTDLRDRKKITQFNTSIFSHFIIFTYHLVTKPVMKFMTCRQLDSTSKFQLDYFSGNEWRRIPEKKLMVVYILTLAVSVFECSKIEMHGNVHAVPPINSHPLVQNKVLNMLSKL